MRLKIFINFCDLFGYLNDIAYEGRLKGSEKA